MTNAMHVYFDEVVCNSVVQLLFDLSLHCMESLI